MSSPDIIHFFGSDYELGTCSLKGVQYARLFDTPNYDEDRFTELPQRLKVSSMFHSESYQRKINLPQKRSYDGCERNAGGSICEDPERDHFRKLALGRLHTLGLTHTGRCFAWGCDTDGQLGLGARCRHRKPKQQQVSHPTQVRFEPCRQSRRLPGKESFMKVVDVTACDRHSGALVADFNDLFNI